MSATGRKKAIRPKDRQEAIRPRADDPRAVPSRAAVVEAARTLFLRNGYVGTTMEEIATLAALTKRTLYNNYGDKHALFVQIVADTIAFADDFVSKLREELPATTTPATLRPALHDLGRRLALAIVRTEVIALRRLLIGEARSFPNLATDYFDRVPGQVLSALASGFEGLAAAGLLCVADAHRAAAQFAYLVAGEPLDRAMLTGAVPLQEEVIACAHEGVQTFLARFETDRTLE